MTRPARSRGRTRRSRWPARSAPRPSSRPACSPWASVAATDPGQARACLRESRELSTELGYDSALHLPWAATIAFLVGDRAATLELGRRAIRGLQWGGSFRMSFVLIAGALAAPGLRLPRSSSAPPKPTWPKAPNFAQLISSTVTQALGEERAREIRARGADMDWDQAVAYTLTQATQALNELRSATQP